MSCSSFGTLNDSFDIKVFRKVLSCSLTCAFGQVIASDTVSSSPAGTVGSVVDPTSVHKSGVTRVATGDQ